MSGKAGKHNINTLLHGSNVTLTGDEGTAVANRALICGASKELDIINATSLQIGSVTVTSTAAELNILDGVTATATELNRAADVSARVTTTTATALSLTATQHAEGVVVVNTDSTLATTLSLPAASGSGARYTAINNVDQTQSNVVVAANGTDVIQGVAYIVANDVTNYAQAFFTSATSDKITLTGSTNAQTTGGFGGDRIECIDISANTWLVTCWNNGTGTLATPFSAT